MEIYPLKGESDLMVGLGLLSYWAQITGREPHDQFFQDKACGQTEPRGGTQANYSAFFHSLLYYFHSLLFNFYYWLKLLMY